VMGESAFFRQDKKALAFRAWLAEIGGSVIDLPTGAFKESGTGVKTRIIIVDKASSEDSPTSTQTSEVSETDLAIVAGEIMEFLNQLMEAETEEELPTLEAIENALPTTVIISPDGEPEETAQPLPQAESAQTCQERGIQKGLPGLADDKLLRLRQNRLL